MSNDEENPFPYRYGKGLKGYKNETEMLSYNIAEAFRPYDQLRMITKSPPLATPSNVHLPVLATVEVSTSERVRLSEL